MLRIAVTGGIACGKSVVGGMLQARGIPVCDTDDLAHAQLRKGTGSYRKIVRTFGAAILDAEGEIRRDKLASIVFGDKPALTRLNKIVHPPVGRAWRSWAKKHAAGKQAAVAVIIPLLFEVDEGGSFDKVVCLASSRASQLARLKARKLSAAGAKARIAAQMPVDRKCDLADYVIVNDGSLGVLEEQLDRVLESILEK